MATQRWDVQDLAGSGGITPTRNGSLSTSDTYKFANDGRTFLLCEKTGATDCVVTVTTPATQDGLAVAEMTDTVPATSGDRAIGPFKPSLYNDDAGDVAVTFSNVTGLSVAVLRVP